MGKDSFLKIKFNIIKKIITSKNKQTISWINFILDKDAFKTLPCYHESLSKGNVLWMDFGVNVGNEFSGLHPALILKIHKKSGDVYVLPIDSGYSKPDLGYQIDIPRIYGFKDKPRYVNLYRAQWLSVKRIDFENRIGHIDKKILEKIFSSLKSFNNYIDK